MKRTNEWKISLSYGIAVAAITVLTGLLFIFECADIYYSGIEGGGDVFSYEIVAQRMNLLLIPTVIWIAAIIVGYTVSTIIPRTNLAKRTTDKSARVKLLKSKLPVGTSEEYLQEHKKLRKIEISRIIVWSACSAFALASAIISIVYLTNLSHFQGLDVNNEILTMLRNILPWIIVAFLLFIGAVIFECVIASKELRIVQSLYGLGQDGTTQAKGKVKSVFGKIGAIWNSKIFIYTIRLVVFSLAVIFIVLGVINGGKDDVLMKAINICTECIGLG
ncbi:MAG: hypothetical protein J1F65_01415 [Clostridiales bacterium]|nr:hypothetical protein [Clostridiales bacterium]